MPETKSPWGRFFFSAAVCALLVSHPAGVLSSQELPLKRNVPGTDSIECPDVQRPESPTEEEAQQAARLVSDADQAVILGDYERGRELLARATELDPTSPELAYQYGRSLERLEQWEPAIEQFCRAQALAAVTPGAFPDGIPDIPSRLEALGRALDPAVPEEASSQFLNGLLQADLGNLEGAEEGFSAAFAMVPDWADAVYNRGVIRMRMGEEEMALQDLQRYLELHPQAADAILVSQRIGQLQIQPGPTVSPGAALGLGLVIPGMGQFYSGRALGGFSVLALAGGAAAAGFLVEKEETRCVGDAPSGGDCPPDRIVSQDTSRPYLLVGLATAGVVTLIGAIEAYLNVRGSNSSGVNGALMAFDAGNARIFGPSVVQAGHELHISLVKVTF